MSIDRRSFFPVLIFLVVPVAARAQSAVPAGCSEVPRADALPSLCAPPTLEGVAQTAPDT